MSDWYSMFLQDPQMLNMAMTAPQQFSQQAAAAGISPPPLGPAVEPGAMDAMAMGPTVEQMNGAPQTSPDFPSAPPLGESLQPAAAKPNQLAGLAGMARPQTPQPQKVSTPAAPRPTSQIKSGELMQLMSSLGLMGGVPQMADQYKLPSTLGAALGGR